MLNGPQGSDGDLGVVLEAINAVAQTLFVGLGVLALAIVDWAATSRVVKEFFAVSPR